MCGIVGYVGHRDAIDFLVEGLRRLEYRGYDSAGVATLNGGANLHLIKTVGRIENLAREVAVKNPPGHIGIGHTRWATHGAPTEENAHPHTGGDGQVLALVHNGVIENHQSLKETLEAEGYVFQSGTDTEVAAHLIASCLSRQTTSADSKEGDPASVHAILAAAVREAVSQLRGTYGIVVLFREHPDVIIAARLGSPMVVGVGQGEHFVASDASPLSGFTEKIVYLADHQIAVITADSLDINHRDRGQIKHNVEKLQIDSTDVDLAGLSTLHAQGNLRTAGIADQHHARPIG